MALLVFLNGRYRIAIGSARITNIVAPAHETAPVDNAGTKTVWAYGQMDHRTRPRFAMSAPSPTVPVGQCCPARSVRRVSNARLLPLMLGGRLSDHGCSAPRLTATAALPMDRRERLALQPRRSSTRRTLNTSLTSSRHGIVIRKDGSSVLLCLDEPEGEGHL